MNVAKVRKFAGEAKPSRVGLQTYESSMILCLPRLVAKRLTLFAGTSRAVRLNKSQY